MATYVAARIFNEVALPPGLPDWLKATIEERAIFVQRQPDTAELTNGSRSNAKSKEDREAEASEQALETMRHAMEMQREQARDRWAAETHSFASVTMTGAGWSELGDDLHHGGELRRWLVERLRRDGRSAQAAEGKADEIADVATIMGKPESERTTAERAKLEKAKDDPTINKIMPELDAQRRKGERSFDDTASLHASSRVSVDAGADLFASAPNLTGRFESALSAIEPLDRPAAEDTPIVVSKPSPASAGLEI